MTEALSPAAAAPERERVLALLKRHGWNTTSFQVLAPGFHYFWDGEDACVAYAETRQAWVAAGAPISPPERMIAVAERFAAAARAAGRRARLFAVEDRFVGAAALGHTLIGEQPVWDSAAWEETVRGARSLREQLRRARSKGVQTRAVPTAEVADLGSASRRALEGLIGRWLASRPLAAMGFLVDVHPFAFPAERRYVVAELAGRIVGFAAAVPVYARGGWFIEDLLREPAAPNGTAELLVDAMMRRLAAEGGGRVTLGLAPLTGAVTGGLRLVRDWTLGLYNFHGVRAFKAKFRPQAWEPVYLAYPAGERGPMAIFDSLRAFAGGSMARFGLRTLLHAPMVPLQALALLLVPWTLLLATADTGRWFPAPWVQRAWVTFDVCLLLGLLWLSLRPRRAVATLLFALVAGDAALTAVEALAFNLPRARGPLDGVVAAAATLGPAAAALLLWHARGPQQAEPRP